MSSYAYHERYYAGKQPVISRSGDARRKRNDENRVNLNRLLSGLILFLLVVLAGELVFHLIISPRLVLRHVSITADGYCSLTNEEILRLAGLEGSVSFISLRERLIEERLLENPMIQAAEVRKRFPDRLSIAITPRKALASVFASSNGASLPLCIDKEGYILSAAAAPAESSMPVVSGVRLMDVRPGMRFPQELISYLEQLSLLQAESPELYNLISEIKFVKKSTGRYEVVLFPGHARLRVRTGPELNTEMLRSILLVIDVVQAQGILDSLAELDFRTGEVVYRTRGG